MLGVSTLGDIRWRLILAAGAGVGVIPWLLLYPTIFLYSMAYVLYDLSVQPERFGDVLGFWGQPMMHMLLAIPAAYWVACRVDAAVVTHVALIALVSVATDQVISLIYVLYVDPTTAALDPNDLLKYLVLALAGGLLGAIVGRNALAGQQALLRASRGIGETRGPQDVVNAIGDNPISLAASGAALWWSGFPAEGDASAPIVGPETWTPWFSRGWPEGLRLDGADVPTRAGSEERPARTLRPKELSSPGRAVWRAQGIRSALLVPLVAPGGERIGLLAVPSRWKRFSKSAVRSYQTIGEQAALALENLRLVEEARRAGRQAGVLRERQRMAHEIHDTLAQGFISVITNVEAAEGVMLSDASAERIHARARHHLDQARLTARESLTEARRLVWALRPEPLEEEASLTEALSRLAKRFSDESGIAASVDTTGEPCPLPSEIEATLFRVAQEALTNVRKHAKGASRVALTLSYMGNTVTLDARDDGAGFDPVGEADRERDRSSGGFGLKGMRERIEGAGGVLSIDSWPGEGTTVAAELSIIGSQPSKLSPDAKLSP